MLTKPPLIIDTCTMSNLINGQAFHLLKELYKDKIIIPSEVYVEALKYKPLEDELYKAIEQDKWMELYVINEIDDLKSFAQFNKRADSGEAAIMVIAKKFKGTVGSDDLSGVVRICKKFKIPILGTMGILYDAYKEEIINHKTGEKIVYDMKNNGRDLPIKKFYDILNWFENGKGKKLY